MPRRYRTSDDIATATVLGARMRDLRESAGLSQREAARRAGMDYKHVRAIEAGACVPGVTTLLRLAHGCGGTLADVVVVLDRLHAWGARVVA